MRFSLCGAIACTSGNLSVVHGMCNEDAISPQYTISTASNLRDSELQPTDTVTRSVSNITRVQYAIGSDSTPRQAQVQRGDCQGHIPKKGFCVRYHIREGKFNNRGNVVNTLKRDTVKRQWSLTDNIVQTPKPMTYRLH